MDPCDKDDCINARPKRHLVCENVDGKKEAYNVASDTFQNSENVVHAVAADKKNPVVDSGCELDNISCISKADGSNGTDTGDHKNLTGSSGSVNSCLPTESDKASDDQSLKYISSDSVCVAECNSQLKGLPRNARGGGLQSAGDFSDKSETSSFRDEHAGAFSPKMSMSSRQGVDKLSNNAVASFKLETKMDVDQTNAALFCGPEQKNQHVDPKELSNVKELPLQCPVTKVMKEVELVDVRLCDICGDVGREYLLALCSRCNDGAEHTYCMRVKMDKVPEGDWVCEDCMEVGNPRKRLVDFEEGTGEVGHHYITSSVTNSGKHVGRTNLDRTPFSSHLGKRARPHLLMNPKAKKRADTDDTKLLVTSGTPAKTVVSKDSNLKLKNRETSVRSALMFSSGGDSPRELVKKVTDMRWKGRLIKGSGLEVHSQHDAGLKEKNFGEKCSMTKTKKEHLFRKLRRCESLQISSPVRAIASSPKINISTENTAHGIGIKRKTTERSYSFDFKRSQPVSPLGSPSLSRGKLDKEAALGEEVRLPSVSRNEHLRTDSSPTSPTSTANKRPKSLLRNTHLLGIEEKMPLTNRIFNKAVKSSMGQTSLKADRKPSDVNVHSDPKLALSKNVVKSPNDHVSLKKDKKTGDAATMDAPKVVDPSKNALKSSSGHSRLKPDKKPSDANVKHVPKLVDHTKNAAKSSNGHTSPKLDKKTGHDDVKNVTKLADVKPDKKTSHVDVKNVSKLADVKPDKKTSHVVSKLADVKNVSKLADPKNAVKYSNGNASLIPDKKTGDLNVKSAPKLAYCRKSVKSSNGHADFRNEVKSTNGHTSLKQDNKIADVDVKDVKHVVDVKDVKHVVDVKDVKHVVDVKDVKHVVDVKDVKHVDVKDVENVVDVKNFPKLANLKNAMKSSNVHTSCKTDKKTADLDVNSGLELADLKDVVKSSNRCNSLKLDRKADSEDVENVSNLLEEVSNTAIAISNGYTGHKLEEKSDDVDDVDVRNFPELADLKNIVKKSSNRSSNGCSSLEPDGKADNVDDENVSKLTEVSNTATPIANGDTGLKLDDVDVKNLPKLIETASNIVKFSNGSTDSKADDVNVNVNNVPKLLDALSDKTTNVQLDRLSSDSTILSDLSHPSPDCVWRGIFKIEKRKEQALQCNGLQAHLSSSASPKVAELVSKWPSKIMLKEACKKDIWPGQFRKYGTCEKDIAVYFFAEDLESYLRYQKLLDCLSNDNLALQSLNLNGVELLVLPSHYLPQSSQRWNKLFYLWGVLKAKHPSILDDDAGSVDPLKGIQNQDSEKPPSCQPVASAVPRCQNGGVSEVISIPVSPEGCGASLTNELRTADIAKIKNTRSSSEEVGDDSKTKIPVREMIDLNAEATDQVLETNETARCEVAVDATACSKINFIGGGEDGTSEFSSPLDNLLSAVEMVENSKVSHVLHCVDASQSSHGRVIDMQVDLEMDQTKTDPLNLERTLRSKTEPQNNGELSLLLSMANKKDNHVDFQGNNDNGGGVSYSSVDGTLSLDLTLALPLENEQLVLKLEDVGLPERNDVDTSLQLW